MTAVRAARAKAEALLLQARGQPGPTHMSVVCAPDGLPLQLLSPPDRAVPTGLWAALAASEQAKARYDPEHASLGKRGRSSHGGAHGARATQRQRTVDAAGHVEAAERGPSGAAGWNRWDDEESSQEDARHRQTTSLGVGLWSQGSQGSQRVGAEGRMGSTDRGRCSPETVYFLDSNFERRMPPLIPPVCLRTCMCKCRHTHTHTQTHALAHSRIHPDLNPRQEPKAWSKTATKRHRWTLTCSTRRSGHLE